MNKEQRVAFLMGRYTAFKLSNDELDELIFHINDIDYQNPLQTNFKQSWTDAKDIPHSAACETWYSAFGIVFRTYIHHLSSPVRKYLSRSENP
ncbi:hypothetical protein [Pedobacter sp.]|uniref:hypothetical protein n=1 Tax=Pedobacter sp. TaxID=1411316 RepID=UPI003D7FFE1E